ncbi:MAG: hypothetical protein HKP61_15605 [Dactylosporangium sp.]|nr:hypothetical protein [Dactylosporangium sp.]NNJ62332.1 hypothetical protein [Dactylosporangium sp.]
MNRVSDLNSSAAARGNVAETPDPGEDGQRTGGVWAITAEDERAQWTFVPLASVGPLRFGMDPGEVTAVLGGARVSHYITGSCVSLNHVGVTTYYDHTGRLACVAIDALRGPQVTYADISLVGRVPSEVERWFLAQAEVGELDVMYSQMADPSSESLGIVVRAQRAGDVVLTRPVFVGTAWAERVGDTSEGFIPRTEWETW